jgi:hypothetical protein
VAIFLITLSVVAGALARDRSDPAVEARIDEATARLGTVTRKLYAAQRQMELVCDAARSQFERQPEWKAAKQELEEARTEVEGTTLAAMMRDPRYARMAVQLRDANAKLDTPRQYPHEDDWKRLKAAVEDQIEAEVFFIRIRRAVEAGDPEVIGAARRFTAAKKVWDGWQSQFDEAVKRSPGYETSEKVLDAAQNEYRDAKAELNSALKAAEPIVIARPDGRK